MARPVTWRTLATGMLEDWQFLSGFSVGMIGLVYELVAPEGWRLALKSASMSILVAGFAAYLFRRYRNVRMLQGAKPVPLLLVAGWSERESMQNLERLKDAITQLTKFKGFQQVERFFNVKYASLVHSRPEQLPPDGLVWRQLLDDAQREARQFLHSITGDRSFHVAVHGPASLALGLGAVLGTRNPLLAYHYVEGRYKPVLDLTHDPRRVKATQRDHDFKFVQVKYPSRLGEDTAVVLDMAGQWHQGTSRRTSLHGRSLLRWWRWPTRTAAISPRTTGCL